MNHTEMLGEYFTEEWGREVIKTDVGFATFRVFDKEFFIGDMFVKETSRHQGEGQKLGLMLEDEARRRGCQYMTCIVTLDEARAGYVTRKVKCFIDFGFTIDRVTNNQLLMSRGVTENAV